jgi:hypothetical protein
MSSALQAVGSKIQVRKFSAVLGALGLALLGASQVQAEPSTNSAIHAVTDMDHANYQATTNCGNTLVMTPQPGTDLMPVDIAASPDMEAFYSRAARQHVTWLDTVACEKSNKAHTIVYTASSGLHSTDLSAATPIWSGYIFGGGTTTANHYIQSSWHVPTVMRPTHAYSADDSYDSSVWIGLGGTNWNNSNYTRTTAHPLIQAGTEQDVLSNGRTHYYFWCQVVPQQPTEMKFITPTTGNPAIPIKPGDEVAAVVLWARSTHSAVLGVCNWTTNTCINFNVLGVSEPSNTTEWIVEAPSIDNIIQPLANFKPHVDFLNGCWAATTALSAGRPSKSDIATALEPSTNDEMPGPIICKNIVAGGSSLTRLYMQPSYPGYVLTNPTVADTTAIKRNGSDFFVIYNGPS